MTRSVNTDRYPDADYTPNDMGPPDNRSSYEWKEKMDELKKDWENGIINEVLLAEFEEKENDSIYQLALMYGYQP